MVEVDGAVNLGLEPDLTAPSSIAAVDPHQRGVVQRCLLLKTDRLVLLLSGSLKRGLLLVNGLKQIVLLRELLKQKKGYRWVSKKCGQFYVK